MSSSLQNRVSVLEEGVKNIRASQESMRQETKAGFENIFNTLSDLTRQVSSQRPNTDWQKVIGSAVAACAIIGALFSLAEWRVGVAQTPTAEQITNLRDDLREARKELVDVKVQIGIEKALRERLLPTHISQR